MKRLMIAILVMLMGSGFWGCQEQTTAPPEKKKMGRDYPLPSPGKQKIPPPAEETTPKVEETTPKGENTPALEKD